MFGSDDEDNINENYDFDEGHASSKELLEENDSSIEEMILRKGEEDNAAISQYPQESCGDQDVIENILQHRGIAIEQGKNVFCDVPQQSQIPRNSASKRV